MRSKMVTASWRSRGTGIDETIRVYPVLLVGVIPRHMARNILRTVDSRLNQNTRSKAEASCISGLRSWNGSTRGAATAVGNEPVHKPINGCLNCV